MSFSQRMVRLLVLLVVLACGTVLFLAAVQADWWRAALGAAPGARWSVMMAGILLLLVGVLFVVSERRHGRKARVLSFENEGGRVSISTDAIADYVAKLSTEFPSVVRLRPVVLPARRTVNMIVHVRVKAGPQIHEVCELLQQRVRESLINGLGISEVGRIEVRVGEIVSEHRPG